MSADDLARSVRPWSAATARGWSYSVRTVEGREVAAHRADEVRSTASVGKLLLLLALARAVDEGSLSADEPVAVDAVPPVADSGLLQHLRVPVLPVGDLAVLTAAVSDNLATNLLLAVVGAGRVDAERARLGLHRTRLLDRVRDLRGPADPPRLSEGTAGELSALLAGLARDEPSRAVASTVRGWLALGTDLSMVGSGLGLDPLAHVPGGGGVQLLGKTGRDVDVRADVGLLGADGRWLAYAALASGPAVSVDGGATAMQDLRDLGLGLRDAIVRDAPARRGAPTGT